MWLCVMIIVRVNNHTKYRAWSIVLSIESVSFDGSLFDMFNSFCIFCLVIDTWCCENSVEDVLDRIGTDNGLVCLS